jgi:3-deoxy-7-phosphoheptulonate synthase
MGINKNMFSYTEQTASDERMYKFAARSQNTPAQRLRIDVNGVTIGGEELVIIAGPCSVESEEQIHLTAEMVAAAGANCLRGGAFKPRTSPYQFQGLGVEGLRYLSEAGRRQQLVTISEVMDIESIDIVSEYVDILQVGSRNMQNFSLLKQLGNVRRPIMLKRGAAATYHEWLMAAEYILNGGNEQVILCERGIRTFETHCRNTLDLTAVPIIHELSHLPVIVDPSHGTGLRKMVPSMACAAIAAGADGLLIEVHPQPESALSDAQQTISPTEFERLMDSLELIAPAFQRKLPQKTCLALC